VRRDGDASLDDQTLLRTRLPCEPTAEFREQKSPLPSLGMSHGMSGKMAFAGKTHHGDWMKSQEFSCGD
jgi:hypothetical protein